MCQFLYRPLGTLNTKERKKIAYRNNTILVWPTEIENNKLKNYNMKLHYIITLSLLHICYLGKYIFLSKCMPECVVLLGLLNIHYYSSISTLPVTITTIHSSIAFQAVSHNSHINS